MNIIIVFMPCDECIIGKIMHETDGRDLWSRLKVETEGREHNFPIIHEAKGINIINPKEKTSTLLAYYKHSLHCEYIL